jgi:hypothetical protein
MECRWECDDDFQARGAAFSTGDFWKIFVR